MPLAPPIRYADDVERLDPSEPDTVAGINAAFDEILERTAKDYGHAVRSVHAKAHALVEGELAIDDDLPAELAQGLFARPSRHKVFLRFSTNPGDILDDAVSLPRGVALKVLDVEGERLPGADGRTQDFLMVNGKVFQAKTSRAFLSSLKLLAKTTNRAEEAKKALSGVLRVLNRGLAAVGVESAVVAGLGGAPNSQPLGETYYSVTAFRYGDHIAKFSLAPVSDSFTRLTGGEIVASERPNAIRETMREQLSRTGGAFELCVQLCRDLGRQPVEDPSVEWREDEAPFQRVGLVTIEPQDSWGDAKVRTVDEAMRFSPWTGLAAHRPLGNINRARREPYLHSSGFRARVNGCPIHEPSA